MAGLMTVRDQIREIGDPLIAAGATLDEVRLAVYETLGVLIGYGGQGPGSAGPCGYCGAAGGGGHGGMCPNG